MAKIELVTAPTGRVVTPGDLRTHARIDATDEDAYLEELLDAAQDEAESFTWRKLLTQTWDQYFDEFDDPLHGQRWPGRLLLQDGGEPPACARPGCPPTAGQCRWGCPAP